MKELTAIEILKIRKGKLDSLRIWFTEKSLKLYDDIITSEMQKHPI